MDGWVGILLLVGLALLAVPVLLLIALLSLSSLKKRVAELEESVRDLRLAAARPVSVRAHAGAEAPPSAGAG
ncbi:MAG TPA: hypothetical protein PLO34_06880, partial [Pseudoxanthomonas sp.]|nr:hypothetical protein [Pseudoxanthomonas sp.]